MAVKEITAVAEYDGKWWVVTVPGYGATQCRTVAQARRQAAVLVADLDAVAPETIAVELEVRVPGIGDELRRVQREQEKQAEAALALAESRRLLMHRLRDRGLSQEDIAAVAGVTRSAAQKALRHRLVRS
ncbi:MAG: hypothetical protein U0Q15_04080 [Kineosporiaceae bacterium]